MAPRPDITNNHLAASNTPLPPSSGSESNSSRGSSPKQFSGAQQTIDDCKPAAKPQSRGSSNGSQRHLSAPSSASTGISSREFLGPLPFEQSDRPQMANPNGIISTVLSTTESQSEVPTRKSSATQSFSSVALVDFKNRVAVIDSEAQLVGGSAALIRFLPSKSLFNCKGTQWKIIPYEESRDRKDSKKFDDSNGILPVKTKVLITLRRPRLFLGSTPSGDLFLLETPTTRTLWNVTVRFLVL
jgi:hypothetical protein